MRGRIDTRGLSAVLVAVALLACSALAAPGAGAAKTKKKGPGTFNVTQSVNLAIPDRAPGAASPFGLASSTITAGKQFKGRQIRDVNVTVQTTGAGTDAADDVRMRLTAPNGATVQLFNGLEPGNVIGPLTLDDEATLTLGSFGLPFGAPTDPRALYVPWIGAARPTGKQLALMDGGPVRGTWTLTVADTNDPNTNTLVSWGLNVVAGRPFLTK